jgi:hypothetical protein
MQHRQAERGDHGFETVFRQFALRTLAGELASAGCCSLGSGLIFRHLVEVVEWSGRINLWRDASLPAFKTSLDLLFVFSELKAVVVLVIIC